MKLNKYKTQFQINLTASQYHQKIGTLIKGVDSLRNLHWYQEVPVQVLVPSYYSTLHRVDWYCETLGLVLEIHGEQHYRIVNFGSIAAEDALINFNNGQSRDNQKRYALEEAGYVYKIIDYKKIRTLDITNFEQFVFGSL